MEWKVSNPPFNGEFIVVEEHMFGRYRCIALFMEGRWFYCGHALNGVTHWCYLPEFPDE